MSINSIMDNKKSLLISRMRVRRFRATRRSLYLKTGDDSHSSSNENGSTANYAIPSQSHSSSWNMEYDEFGVDSENDENENDTQRENSETGDAEITENERNNGENELIDISDRDDRNNSEESSEEDSIAEANESKQDIDSDEVDSDEVEVDEEAYDSDGEARDIVDLQQWAIKSGIPHCHLDTLLKILRKRALPTLPACSKTFLRTSSSEYKIKNFQTHDGKEIGEFVYFGIAAGLERCVNKNLHPTNELQLQFNCDGLPLYKSSAKQFWPILCKVHVNPDVYKPFLVAVFCGIEKPNNLDEYLCEFVQEMNELSRNGILIDEQSLTVRIMCFVCDKPARSFIKCIKGHGGYYACERCTIQGIQYERRTVYLSSNCEDRTDVSFRSQENREHHTGLSPLLQLGSKLDMVKCFVLDFMHLGCLGIMKKMLTEIFLEGHSVAKLNQGRKQWLSQCLVELQSQIPDDFQRTTRTLAETAKWKATEYRLLLLYVGPVVFRQILPKKYYRHFLLLHCACRILCSKELALQYNLQAKAYLKSFVLLTKQYYGKKYLILNMHSLIHLVNDAKNMECSLNDFTSFPFENSLGKIKKVLRTGHRPLAQLCRRMHESHFANFKKVTFPPSVTILRKGRTERNGSILVKKIKYKQVIITTKSPNNTVLLNNKILMNIDAMHVPPNENDTRIVLTGTALRIIEPMFTYPCNSETLKMWKVDVTSKRIIYPLQSVAHKMTKLTIKNYDNSNNNNDEDDSDNEATSTFVISFLHM
ncbi:uncharacterized protein [Linepithema humile]|uniref:uncharacterized protein n=1 Tax=Linepithema humile TaxID=83485 RepID=UPI00351E36FD